LLLVPSSFAINKLALDAMPLVLAIHTIQSAPSATVPFAVILLQDSITNKKVPADFKCRQASTGLPRGGSSVKVP
jgi:hypothetical protein